MPEALDEDDGEDEGAGLQAQFDGGEFGVPDVVGGDEVVADEEDEEVGGGDGVGDALFPDGAGVDVMVGPEGDAVGVFEGREVGGEGLEFDVVVVGVGDEERTRRVSEVFASIAPKSQIVIDPTLTISIDRHDARTVCLSFANRDSFAVIVA